jgi:major vault protein
VTNNQVTDIVTVTTRDLVTVDLKLSYRINFEGDDPEKWFAVENYVKRLCDHVRSLLQHTAKQVGIREFNNNSIPVVRDAILGTKGADGSARPGLKFEDNGMRVCDVEVLTVTIGDASVNKLLTDAQNKAVSGELELARLEKELELATRRADIQKQLDDLKEQAEQAKAAQAQSALERELALALAKAENLLKEAEEQAKVDEARRKATADAANAELALERAAQGQQLELEARHSEQRILNLTKEQELKLKAIEAEAKALGDKAAAISPALVAALGAFGDRYIAGKAAEAMSPLAHLGGGSVAEVLSKLLRGTALEGAVKQLAPGNGVSPTTLSTGAHS